MTDSLDLAELRREMIKHHMRSRGIKFFCNDDGDALAVFSGELRDLQVMVSTDDSGGVVGIDVKSTETFPIEQTPLLLLLLNKWSRDHRWPRLTVSPRMGCRVQIIADGHLFMTTSLDQAEVDRFIESNLLATMSFWDDFAVPSVSNIDAEASEMFGGDVS